MRPNLFFRAHASTFPTVGSLLSADAVEGFFKTTASVPARSSEIRTSRKYLYLPYFRGAHSVTSLTFFGDMLFLPLKREIQCALKLPKRKDDHAIRKRAV